MAIGLELDNDKLRILVVSGAPYWNVLQNIYSADIVSYLEKSAEQIMNLYKRGINL